MHREKRAKDLRLATLMAETLVSCVHRTISYYNIDSRINESHYVYASKTSVLQLHNDQSQNTQSKSHQDCAARKRARNNGKTRRIVVNILTN